MWNLALLKYLLEADNCIIVLPEKGWYIDKGYICGTTTT